MLDAIDRERPYITTPQAAERSGLTANYIATLLRKGQLEGFRLAREWFVYADSLEQYMTTAHKPGPKGPRKKAEQQGTEVEEDARSLSDNYTQK